MGSRKIQRCATRGRTKDTEETYIDRIRQIVRVFLSFFVFFAFVCLGHFYRYYFFSLKVLKRSANRRK